MLKPDKMEKAIIRTCKGHHKCRTTLEALKHVVAEHCGLHVDHVELYSIYYWVKKVYLKFVSIGRQEQMLDELFRFKRSIMMEDMIYEMRYYIMSLQVKDDEGNVLIDLGDD